MATPSSSKVTRFADRRAAGKALAAQLSHLSGRIDVVVLALPRGGVPVGAEVARALGAPLDVFVVRKLGFPGYPEFAMGAIASGGVRILNEALLADYRVPRSAIDAVLRAERTELARRERLYRQAASAVSVAGRTVVIVDDGLATGATMLAAVEAVRRLQPASVVVAVPVGAGDACQALRRVADAVVCVRTPEPFGAVGLWYEEFGETTDDEVRDLLALATGAPAAVVREGFGDV
jgi:predicted phosphoribosyltransferase